MDWQEDNWDEEPDEAELARYRSPLAAWEQDHAVVEEAEELTQQGAPVTLLERSTGGWSTELRLLADGSLVILAQQGEGSIPQAAGVPPEKALDAFWHPYCYLGTGR